MDSHQQSTNDAFRPILEWLAANGNNAPSSSFYSQSDQRVSQPLYKTSFMPTLQESLGGMENMDDDSPSMSTGLNEPLGFGWDSTPITNPFDPQWVFPDIPNQAADQLGPIWPEDAAYSAAPALPRLRLEEIESIEQRQTFPVQYQGDHPYVSQITNAPVDPVANHLPSAANLVGGHRNRRAREVATLLPWGLQRILTHEFVEQTANKHGVPMPPITNADVQLYCNFATNHFDARASTFPPFYVDLRFLDSIEVSAEELLMFFPEHVKWHDMIFRLVQNGWMPTDITSYINFTRGLQPPHQVRRNTTSQYLRAADKTILGRQPGNKFARRPWKTTCFTTKNWKPHEGRAPSGTIDYFLVDLADGVVQFLEGTGARLLTRAIRHAITCGHTHVKLSQLKRYIRENLLMFPPLPSLTDQMVFGEHPDYTAVLQFRNLMLEAKPV